MCRPPQTRGKKRQRTNRDKSRMIQWPICLPFICPTIQSALLSIHLPLPAVHPPASAVQPHTLGFTRLLSGFQAPLLGFPPPPPGLQPPLPGARPSRKRKMAGKSAIQAKPRGPGVIPGNWAETPGWREGGRSEIHPQKGPVPRERHRSTLQPHQAVH